MTKTHVSRAPLMRSLVLVVTAWVGAAAFEYAQQADRVRVGGEVASVRAVHAGRGGDGREFTIRYDWQGVRHWLVTRRGILDSLGPFRGLAPGSGVPLAVDPRAPDDAIIDSFNARYPMTLSFTATILILGSVMGVMLFRASSHEPPRSPAQRSRPGP